MFKLMINSILFFAILLLGAIGCKCQIMTSNPHFPQSIQSNARLTYPYTPKQNISDNYHNTVINDPYRWLENDTAANTKQWIKDQNQITFNYLNEIPFRSKIRSRLEELINFERVGQPVKCGEYYFYYKNNGLQNQAVLYKIKGLEGTPEVFIDPNTLSQTGTITVEIAGFSNDNKYVTLSYSEAGSDWRTFRVREVDTGRELIDEIKWVKFSGSAWFRDGFYYSAYEKPQGSTLSSENRGQRVFYHKLGTPQLEDILIYENPQNPLLYNTVDVTEDEKYLILTVQNGTEGNQLYFKPADKINSGGFIPIIENDYKYKSKVINHINGRFIIYTNFQASNYKLIAANPINPETEKWETIIQESEHLLDNASTGGGKIFGTYLIMATSRIYQFSDIGTFEKEIELPTLGTSNGISGKWNDKILFYSFTSFTYPLSIYKYDVTNGSNLVFFKPVIKFDPTAFETKQVYYTSKDSTIIPMFLVYKKGLQMNGTNPTYLYSYGGFNINLTPSFSSARVALLEMGAIFAMPNIRGGGEFGEEWHKAGMLDRKQNVFDDFIAAAEFLITQRYTSTPRLAIIGGSNGGLLVGACMTQRPELFGVAIPKVGVLDMLRYHKFTVGWGWIPEYGYSDDSAQFIFLYKYSPLHNIRSGVSYPATMVMTADHDDRVVPAHSFKFIATLQEYQYGNNPVLIRIETSAGHGAGKPTNKILDEMADEYSFIFRAMNYNPF